MHHRSFLLYDKDSHKITGTLNTPDYHNYKSIPSPHIEMKDIIFPESLRINPETKKLYIGDAPIKKAKKLPSNKAKSTQKTWWKFWEKTSTTKT